MKYSTIIKTITLGSLLAISASSVQAMTLEAKDVDLNSDGKVTQAEIESVIRMHFLKMDKDGDNIVSVKSEWPDGSDHND